MFWEELPTTSKLLTPTYSKSMENSCRKPENTNEVHCMHFMFTLAIVTCVVMIIQSPDWDSRGRSVTAPIDPAFYSSSLTTSLTNTSPGPHPVAQADLPPLPGEWGTPPPPLPKRGEGDDVGVYTSVSF